MKAFIIAVKLMKEIGNDKRTIAMLFVAPLFIISLLYVVLNNGIQTVTLGLPDGFPIAIENENIHLKTISEADGLAAITNGDIDAYVSFQDQNILVTLEGTDPTISGKVMQYLQQSVSAQIFNKMQTLKLPIQLPKTNVAYVYGHENMSTFDHIAPFLMGYIVFFLVFLLSGIAFLRERISGTMTRMMATSVRRREIVLGYLLGFGFFAVIQTIIIQLYMVFVLRIHNEGNFFLALMINIFVAAASLTLGLLLSAFARNEFQLFQFIPIIIIPQTLFAGLFPLRDTPEVIQWLSRIFPLYYAGDALRNVMLRGKGLESIWMDLLFITGFLLLFLILNMQVLKKYRNT